MPGNPIDDIDFEYWTGLASSDPEKFEQLRQDKISELIEKASNPRQKRRLRGLQWKIDLIRKQHKESPMAACLAISRLMWETFAHLSEVLHGPAESDISGVNPPMQANILQFPEMRKNLD